MTLLKIWSGIGKPAPEQKISSQLLFCCTYPLTITKPNQENLMFAELKRMYSFFQIMPGLEQLCTIKNGGGTKSSEREKKFVKNKALIEEINEKHPVLLRAVATKKITLEEVEKLLLTFGNVPEAIVEILNGADEDAVAVKYGLIPE